MTLKTLGKTTWSKIAIGEVFAWNFCWIIYCKMDNTNAMRLTCDLQPNNNNNGRIDSKYWLENGEGLYKLSLDTQRLWRCDHD